MQNHYKQSTFRTTSILIRRVLFILVLIILIIGGTFTFLEMQTSKKALQKTMITTALLLATSIDSQKITHLSGTIADENTHEYIDLRDHIIRLQHINPQYRYLYLFGKTNKPHPYFLMGTAQKGTPDYSPPGQVYYEDSPSLNEVYATKKPILGPSFKDRWGTWVSALVPIFDSKSNELIAVFGMDMDAKEFQFEILRRSFMPLIITLFCIVILALGTEYLRRRQLYNHIHLLQQTEVALRESAEYQRVLFTDSQQAIVVMDDETEKFIDCNKAAVDIFGFSYREQLIGLSPVDISPPTQYNGESSKLESNKLNKICRDKGEVSFKWRCKNPSGKTWDSEVHLMVFHYREKPMMQISITDITDRKQSEDALRKSEERNRAILNVLPDIFFVFNRKGIFIDAQVNEKNLFYVTPEHFIGKCMFDIIPSQYSDLSRSSLEKVFKTGEMQVFQFEIEYLGEVLQFETRFVLKSDDEVLSIVSDITDRKRKEKALQISEERNRAILRVLPDMMFVFNKQGIFVDVYANDKQKLYSKPDLTIGRNIKDVLPLEIAELTLSFIDKVFKTGVMQVFQYQLDIEGKVLNFEARLVLKSEYEVLTIVSDITYKIQSEIENKRLQAQLAQAQKIESIGRLAGGVAHDFNNMLQAIIGHSELALLDVEPNSSVHSNLIEIHKAAERSADLTRQLLAFARKQKVLPRVINLNETVESMIKLLKRLMGEDIDLKWLPGNELWQIKIDPSQIDQIMANLCVNARDAITGVGQVIIETENVTIESTPYLVQTQMEPGNYVKLVISDNGHGMSNDAKDHLFEPFFTTKGLGEGTGLGLATVYGIVKQNNGFINVYSELNQGTTFKIYFPQYSGVNPISVTKTDQNDIQNGSETLLIVEDEPSILKMSTTMLSQLGYNVLFATNPTEAMNIAQEYSGEIHLLITDVIMPNQNGWDLSQRLHGDYPSMKCLFMSGYTSTVITSQGLLHESTNFIQKPFSLRSLGSKVREVLDSK